MTLEELHNLAIRIAAHMGWRYAVAESMTPDQELLPGALIRPGLTSYGVRVRLDWRHKTHLEIAGNIPTRDKEGGNRWTHSGEIPTIRVRCDRDVQAIAKEIRRRLLPAYGPVYTESRETLERLNEYIDTRNETLKVLEPYGRVSTQRHDLGRVYLPCGGVATVTGAGVDLQLSVSPADAEFILEYLAQRET